MSRFSKLIICVAAMAAAVSCGNKARIDGTISEAPSSEVIVKLLNFNQYQILDTVKTDASGRFSYKAEIEKGQPEFIYVFYKDTKVASLLLEAGDKVNVTADTLGTFTVEGSEESAKLAEVEKAYADALLKFSNLSAQAVEADGKDAEALRRQLAQEYVTYYRSCVKYVMKNSKSLTVVPVLYQNLGTDLPVFAQETDAIHFANIADSLETVYPDSKYVKALRSEAERRHNYLEIRARINSAEQVGYLDIELPDIKAQKVKLSEVDSKAVLLFFWSATDASQKMFNLDILKSIYEEYNAKGLEIYQVSLDVDKGTWARVVKEQNLPWINVCDSRGSASPYVMGYNIGAIPAAFMITDGELSIVNLSSEKAFRRDIEKLMK